jgi:predicted transcriptional regulator
MNRRSQFEMNYSILDSINNRPILMTEIMLKSKLNFDTTCKMVSRLELRGYVKKEEISKHSRPNLKPKHYVYILTPIGSRVLLQIKSIINIFK